MKVAVLRETYPGERRVALVPALVPTLAKQGWQTVVETGAGEPAGFPDAAFAEKGAEIVADRAAAIAAADVVLQVRAFGANLDAGRGDLDRFRPGQVIIGLC